MGEVGVIARSYLSGPDNHLLVENRSFGRRKYINVNMNRQFSIGKNKTQGGQHQWIHPEDALLKGNIVYSVKFLGRVEVDQPKGSSMVKESIRKMKFNKQIRKAEGQKPLKVDLVISVDGVIIQEPRFKITQHQYPLHRISYCADDKSDKRMFSFIAKEADSNTHNCFVFDSEKCAESITLTVGQAFDLAYRRFRESGHNIMNKQHTLLQKKVQQLTSENLELKEKVADLERLVDPTVLANYELSKTKSTANNETNNCNPVVGRKLENLLLDDISTRHKGEPQVNGTPPAANSPHMPVLAPPPPVPHRANIPATPPQQQPNNHPSALDLFGAPPFQTAVITPSATPTTPHSSSNPFVADAFGMSAFSPAPYDLDQQIQSGDRELMDLQAGFSQGLSFGTDDFSLDDFDPLGKR